MTAEQKNLIYNLRKAGQSYTVIADKLGFSKSAVATYCQRNGLGSILVENNLITKSNRVKSVMPKSPEALSAKPPGHTRCIINSGTRLTTARLNQPLRS